MKRYVITLMLILLVSSASELLTAPSASESPFKVIATVPPFVRPGDENVTIQLTVKLEEGEYEDVEVELILPPFFSASWEGSDEFTLGDMSTTGFMNPPMGVAVFQVDVSSDAVYGDYTIQVYIKTETALFTDSFTIHVVGETLIEVTDVVTSLDIIEPGADFDLRIAVKNVGSNSIKWMKVVLNPNPTIQTEIGQTQMTQIPSSLTSVTTAPSIPTSAQESGPVIIPVSSDLEQIFKNISPGKTVVASYALSVENTAESKNHAMTVTLVYQDETGMIFTESRTIGIKIRGAPNIELQGIEVDPAVPYHGEEAIISITLENNGTAEAHSVKVSITSTLGQYTSFIGTMKRNENNAAVFKILIPEVEQSFSQYFINNLLNRTEVHKYSMTIQVFYEDQDGNPSGFTEGWELTTRTKQDKTIFYIMGGVLLLIIIAVWRIQGRRHLKVLEE